MKKTKNLANGELLTGTKSRITGPNKETMRKTSARLDSLTKPPGSLGALEEIAIKLSGIRGNPMPEIRKKVNIIMVGDHGIVSEGVSAFPQQVTRQMVLNFLNGGAAVNVLARHVNADVVVVNVGMAEELEHPQLVNRLVKKGTNNMVNGPAMTREEAVRSIEAGIEVVYEEVDKGADLVATGDMGIGNTTPSSAILAVYSGQLQKNFVGPGTGLSDEGVGAKINNIERALRANSPDTSDALDILSKVGGLEIGGLVGVILGAAARRVPVVIDGLIAGAAALIAVGIEPVVKDYLFASHQSKEPGHVYMLGLLGLRPMLVMDMRLGEGTGAVLGMGIIEAAAKILREMATFEEAGVAGKDQ